MYKAGEEYNIRYYNNKGEEQTCSLVPETDMNRPQVIKKLKEENKDFLKLIECKLLEGDNEMEYKTYKDLVEDGRAADVCDNVYDMCVYIDYMTDSDDYYDQCLEQICSELQILDADIDHSIVTCNITDWVKNHLKELDEVFEIDAPDEDSKVEEFVNEMFDPLVSGGATEKAYEQLYYALIGAPVPYTKQPEVKPENVVDHEVKTDDVVEEAKIEEAKKDIGELVPALKERAYELLQSEEMGFPEDEAKDYTVIELKPFDNAIKVEVRAELTYDGMMELIDCLNPIVRSYDKESYFDMEDSGIAVAIIEGYPIPVVEEAKVEDPMEEVVETLVEEIVQESEEEKIEEAYFNLYKAYDELYGIAKKTPQELKEFLNSLNELQRISEKDFNLLMKYADRHQEIIDECGYESKVLDEAVEEKVEAGISKERKAEIIAELFDWIDYHELDAYEFLNITEEDLDKSSHLELDEEKMNDIIDDGIACVIEHVNGDEEEKIAFKNVIGLNDEECKLLGLEWEEVEPEYQADVELDMKKTQEILDESIKDTDFIVYRSTVEGPLYLTGLSTTFRKEDAVKYPTEEEAKEALHDYIENVVDPDADEFKVAKLNESKGQVDLSLNLKEWYKEAYPDDDIYEEIIDTVTFQDVQDALDKGDNVYDVMGAHDSIVRERVFEKLSQLRNVDYDVIYNAWLNGGDRFSDEEMEAFKKAFANIVNKKVETKLEEDETTPAELEQFADEVEEAVEEIGPTDESEELAVNVVNDSVDVLEVDERMAINGYEDFLNAAKELLAPALYEVLEKEVREIIADEEDHITILENIKATFHLDGIEIPGLPQEEIIEEPAEEVIEEPEMEVEGTEEDQ